MWGRLIVIAALVAAPVAALQAQTTRYLTRAEILRALPAMSAYDNGTVVCERRYRLYAITVTDHGRGEIVIHLRTGPAL